jgi:hypothetical protein
MAAALREHAFTRPGLTRLIALIEPETRRQTSSAPKSVAPSAWLSRQGAGRISSPPGIIVNSPSRLG